MNISLALSLPQNVSITDASMVDEHQSSAVSTTQIPTLFLYKWLVKYRTLTNVNGTYKCETFTGTTTTSMVFFGKLW